MGPKQTSLLGDVTNSISVNQVEKDYYHQIYLQHRKTPAKFREEVASIIKRASQLHYKWVQELLTLLKRSSREELYSLYKSTLKENCLLNGCQQRVFCASRAKQCFFIHFDEKCKKIQSCPSLSHLKNLTTEVKCFLMVLTWLHRIVAVGQQNYHKKSSLSVQEEEKIRICVLMLGELVFKNVQQDGKKMEPNRMKQYDQEFIALLDSLNKKQSFHSREIILERIEKTTKKEENSFTQKMQTISSIMGKARVLSCIFVIKELGTVDLPMAFAYFDKQIQKIDKIIDT